MALDIRLIQLNDFLRTNMQGHIDLEASIRDFKAIARACVENHNHHVLIDAREARGKGLSAIDIWTLASSLEEFGIGRQMRIAVLNAPKDEFDRAAFLETCASNRGFNIRAFREFEAALFWLATDEQPLALPGPG